MNIDSRLAYFLFFKRVFDLLSEICGVPVEFHYLHNNGIRAIIMDMWPAQISGKKLIYY